jgi:maltose-binding protein MalE
MMSIVIDYHNFVDIFSFQQVVGSNGYIVKDTKTCEAKQLFRPLAYNLIQYYFEYTAISKSGGQIFIYSVSKHLLWLENIANDAKIVRKEFFNF